MRSYRAHSRFSSRAARHGPNCPALLLAHIELKYTIEHMRDLLWSGRGSTCYTQLPVQQHDCSRPAWIACPAPLLPHEQEPLLEAKGSLSLHAQLIQPHMSCAAQLSFSLLDDVKPSGRYTAGSTRWSQLLHQPRDSCTHPPHEIHTYYQNTSNACTAGMAQSPSEPELLGPELICIKPAAFSTHRVAVACIGLLRSRPRVLCRCPLLHAKTGTLQYGPHLLLEPPSSAAWYQLA